MNIETMTEQEKILIGVKATRCPAHPSGWNVYVGSDRPHFVFESSTIKYKADAIKHVVFNLCNLNSLALEEEE